MGVDSRLALLFLLERVGSHDWQFRGRVAVKEDERLLYPQIGLVDEGKEWQSHL